MKKPQDNLFIKEKTKNELRHKSSLVVEEDPNSSFSAKNDIERSFVVDNKTSQDKVREPIKKKKYLTANTIDEKHTHMLDHFHTIENETIPDLLNEIELLKKKAELQIKLNKIDEYMDITDNIVSLKKQIRILSSKKNKYLLDNSKYIFHYFEEKKDISEGGGKQNVNLLNNFFKIKSPVTTVPSNTIISTPIQDSSYHLQSSKNMYQNYWKNVNNDIINLQDFVQSSDICYSCHNGEMIPQEDEGILICNNTSCGTFITHIIDNAKPANKEPPNEVSYTAYIRLNHFKEILSQFQAKETTQIPEEVIESIRARIKKERITDLTKLTHEKMRDILRKLGLNKYFEHIQYINSIFGIKPPQMNEELHETMCVLFIEIQGPWAIHCPKERTNFFNYTYTLYQLCVLLSQTQYLPYIVLMKDLQKQREQDLIWEKVCADLDWLYIPSV